jgi:ubiquinone/menaquinone biosynthesis C-methylase UbiE
MSTVQETRNPWDGIAAGYDEFVTPSHFWLGHEGVTRVGLTPGMRFLDVAAGSGALSIPAARLGAQVLSVDLSAAMLDRLNARAQKEKLNLKTKIMDGHALKLEDNTFDICGSQFGVMLFPDMPRGVREMARVTKPGGRVLMSVFGSLQEVDFFNFFVSAIRIVIPSFTGPSIHEPPLPFQLQDPDKLHQVLEKAGLKEISVETITESLEFESGRSLWQWLINSNPIAGAILGDLNLAKDQVTLIQLALERMVRDRAEGSPTAVLTNPIHIGIGTK